MIKICRFCLFSFENPSDEMKSLEETLKLIQKIFGIEIKIDSKNSIQQFIICQSCSEKLDVASEFHATILSSQQMLQTAQKDTESVKETFKVEPELKIEEIDQSEIVPEQRRTRSTNISPKAKCVPIVQRKKIKEENEIIQSDEKEKNCDNIETEDQQIADFYSLSCSDCDEKFNKFALYKSHMMKKHNIPRPMIICCNIRLTKRCRLYEHMIYHVDPDQWKCQDCGRYFKNSLRLENHRIQWHMSKDERKHQCDKCPKKFIALNNLKVHLETHLSAEEKRALKQYECADCGRSYKSKSLVDLHMRKVHLQLFTCICDICAKSFKNKNDFLYHYESTHTGKIMPKVKCSQCDKYLLNEKCLKSHISRIHKHGGLHVCNICGKISPTRQGLRSHQIYVHESDRKFKCTYCDKAFKREVGLKEHLTTHLGGALYTCQFCSKTFNSGANMYSHRKRAHPVEHEKLMEEKLKETKSNSNGQSS
uniref:CSON001156 protein n=1 Tax=Culicoides sonorensis TaxID=179676 RepID=A0A336KZR7_CULSO